MKCCSKCLVEKPLADFNKESAARDGLQSRCRECSRAHGKARYQATQGTELARKAAYRAANREALRQYDRKNAAQSAARKRAARQNASPETLAPAKARAASAAKMYRATDPEKYRRKIAAWQQSNKDKVRATTSRRKARKLQATPAWANADKIAAFYRSADALGMLTGDWYHVDHIVPLQGRIVCGLHNEFNLQVLPAAENIAKSNRIWPDQP
jgi:glucan-binding YG repeat protein